MTNDHLKSATATSPKIVVFVRPSSAYVNLPACSTCHHQSVLETCSRARLAPLESQINTRATTVGGTRLQQSDSASLHAQTSHGRCRKAYSQLFGPPSYARCGSQKSSQLTNDIWGSSQGLTGGGKLKTVLRHGATKAEGAQAQASADGPAQEWQVFHHECRLPQDATTRDTILGVDYQNREGLHALIHGLSSLGLPRSA